MDMGKSSDMSPGKGEKAEPEAAKTLASESTGTSSDTPQPQPQAIDNSLPVVESPKLDGGEAIEPSDADAVNEAPSEPAGATEVPAAQPRSSRFALLAATIALAAALGAFLGTLTASGVDRLVPAAAPSSSTADASSVLRALQSQAAELSAIKANLDGATRNATTQFASIADRLDRVQRAAADPATMLARIADTVDRLDKLNTATPETTSSIEPSAPPPTAPKLTDRILGDWVVQDVHGDRALVESRYGGVFNVGAGSVLPGLGRVETVKRQDGQWVVVTARGLITSGR